MLSIETPHNIRDFTDGLVGWLGIFGLWDVMLCQWVIVSQHFEGMSCLQSVGKH